MKKLLSAFINGITAPFRWVARGIRAILSKSFLGVFLAEEPEDTPIFDTIKKVTDEPSDFFSALLEHLADLRGHIFRSVLALILASAVAFYFSEVIKAWLAAPFGNPNELTTLGPTEGVGAIMRITFVTGFSMALPYIAFEILRFTAPGISRKARLFGLLSIPFISLFFAGGVIFAYYIMLPPAITFLGEFGGFNNQWTAVEYFPFATKVLFWVGLSFEFPLVTFVLSAMRVLPPRVLRENWRLAVIILTILAAMITPTVDPFNMLIVLLPLWTLYGLGIIMAQLAWRGKDRA